MHLDEVQSVVGELVGHLVPVGGWRAGTAARPGTGIQRRTRKKPVGVCQDKMGLLALRRKNLHDGIRKKLRWVVFLRQFSPVSFYHAILPVTLMREIKKCVLEDQNRPGGDPNTGH